MNPNKLLLATLSQDAYFQVNKQLVKELGFTAAIVLSFLIDKYKYFMQQGQLVNNGFFLSAKKINELTGNENLNVVEFELGIGEVARRSSFRILQEKNLIRIEKKGHPARHFYYLNSQNILNLLSSPTDTEVTSPTQGHVTSGMTTKVTSPTDTEVTYNKNKEEEQRIKTNNNTTEPASKTLIESLKEIATANNLAYSINANNERLFHNKLAMDMGVTNDQILEQAQRYENILRQEPNLFWLKNDAFGFKYLHFNWGKIDAWHSAKKSNIIPLKRKTYSAEEHNRVREEYERSRNAR